MHYRVGKYKRISLDVDGLEEGVGRQDVDLDRLAGVHDVKVAGDYTDNDVSAFKRNVKREDFERMLKDLKAGRIDGIIAYDIDRLVRQPRDLERIIDIYETAKRPLFFATCSQSFDLSTPDGRFMARLMASIANKSSEDTARRVSRKALDKAQKGQNPGGDVPCGWDPKDRNKPHPTDGPIITNAARGFLRGKRMATLLREATEAGLVSFKTGKPYNLTNFKTIVVHPRNAGIRVYRGAPLRDDDGNYVMGSWEPLITVQEWEAIQAIIDANKMPDKDTARKRLLPGILRCGVCGTKLASRTKPQDKTYVYRCVKDYGGCGKLSVTGPYVDELVTELVLADYERSAGRIKKLPEAEWPSEGELTEVETEISDLRAKWKAKEIKNSSTFIFLMEDLEETRDKLRAARALFYEQHIEAASSEVDIRKKWKGLALEQKRKIIMKSLKAVIVHPVGAQGPKFDPSRLEPVFN